MSENVYVKASSLSAIGDAIREKKGEEKYLPLEITEVKYTDGSSFNTINDNNPRCFILKNINGYAYNYSIITEATLTVDQPTTGTTPNFYVYGKLVQYNEDTGTYSLYKSLWGHSIKVQPNVPIDIWTGGLSDGWDEAKDNLYCAIVFNAPFEDGTKITYNVKTTLDGNIPNPETNYKPSEMANEIRDLQVIPSDVFIVSGKSDYRFANNNWNWLIDLYGSRIITNNLSSVGNMFYDSTQLTNIPFSLNLQSIGASGNYTFGDCQKLKNAPYIVGELTSMSSLFSNCYNLREIPEDWATKIGWNTIHNSTTGMSGIFYTCRSLREIPQNLINELYNLATGASGPYTSTFSGCSVLERVNNMPVITSILTSNRFGSMFSNCYRLKSFTFKITDNGTVDTANWKSQVLDLSESCGFASTTDQYFTDYSSGLTDETKINSLESYNRLKDNPDAWVNGPASYYYSRYNKASAIETISSLPDTSAYGTNTIKFKGLAGRDTDEGAINTMTPEEIAVATVKGWTVSFVN